MITPKSNKKRKHQHSSAVVQVQHQRAGAKPSKADKRFEKKVLKVLKEPTATGKYTQVITQSLVQQAYNQYNVQTNDIGSGTNGGLSQFEFFSPRQFKDAEAILFNNKTATWNSWATTTEGANQNFPAQMTTKVNGSSATFRFKNVSQHKTIVEMYICHGKGGGTTPWADWETSIVASGKYTINGLTTAPAALNFTTSTHVHMDKLEPFDSYWKVEKVVMKFEPGEEAFHLMKGPGGYMMDGPKKLQENSAAPGGAAPSWKGPDEKGAGVLVFFRTLNNLTLVTSTTGSQSNGTNRTQICHPPHIFANGNAATAVGGVAMEITRHYNIEAPMGVTVALLDSHVLNINYGNPSGTINDIEIEADQPMVPSDVANQPE